MDYFKFFSIDRCFFFCFQVFILFSCSRSEYEDREAIELGRGVRRDSIFHSIHFGMSSQDYRNHCAAMNRKGVFSEGPANSAVEFDLYGLPYPSKCFFTPSFKDNKIYQISALIQYDSWAPWNRRLFSDSLQQDLVKMIKSQYKREDFLIVPKPNTKSNESAYVLLDANQRITILIENDAKVRMIFRDITIKDKDLTNQIK